MPADTITIIGTEDTAYTRSDEVTRVTKKVSVVELNRRFNEFMSSLQNAFAVEGLQTEAGAFELSEIEFSAELSAEGNFKLLGTGVGVTAGSTLTFVLKRKDRSTGKS